MKEDGTVQVGGLDVARVLKADEKHAMTEMGTPPYMSPEIIEGKPYNYKVKRNICDFWYVFNVF